MINENDDGLLGKVIAGNYLIEDFAGKGGMGKVYIARNLKLGNKWAIKVVSKDYQFANYFRKEAEILERLNHPNMPKIIDLIEDDENIYIVETYIEGTLLSNEIMNKRKLNNDEVINYFLQMAELIEYLHNIKPFPIVYRDLKPNNIIISHNDRLVLIDFSIAKLHDLDSNDETIIAGNKYYSSPEQLDLSQHSDTRSDIYALGMLAFRMSTGKLKQEIDICDLEEFNEINPELKDIIEKCIYKNANLRYQDIKELVSDLKQLKKDETKMKYNERKIILVDGMQSSGKTFIASLLAKTFANNKVKIAFVDLSNELGAAEYFNVKLDDNLTELIKENKLDVIKTKSYKCKKYLDVYKGEICDEKNLLDFLRKLIKINDLIIVDLNDKEYSEIYEFADEIILVLTQDEKIENLTNKKVVEYVDKGLDLNRIKIVANKYEKDFKNANEILKDINIIPKIFRCNDEFKDIYKVPEMPRIDLLKLAKSKEISLEENEVTKSIYELSKHVFTYSINKYHDENKNEINIVAEVKATYYQFKNEINKIIKHDKENLIEEK